MDRAQVIRLKDELLGFLKFEKDYEKGVGLNKKVLLVEGKTDKVFVEGFQNDDVHCISVVEFKKADSPFRSDKSGSDINYKQVIINILLHISMFPEVFDFPKGAEKWPLYGLVDRDEGVQAKYSRVEKLFFTDTHDIETLMLSTDPEVLTRLEGCYVTDEEKKEALYLTNQLTVFRAAVYDEGSLQYSAIKNDDGTTEYEPIVRDGKLILEKMIDRINSRMKPPLSREKLKKTKGKISMLVKKYLDKSGAWKESLEDFEYSEEFWKSVNGHDVLDAIRYVNESARELFTNKKGYSQNREFELALSKAYDYKCLKNTVLFEKMDDAGLVKL